jgi:hypothetical protein
MRHTLKAILVTATLLLASVLTVSPVEAAFGITSTATQTYELQPAQHVVHVTIDLSVRNTTPSTTTYEGCIKYQWDPYWGWQPYYTTCPHTTNYYVDNSSLWVEDGARNLKLTSDAGSVSKTVSTHSYGFTNYTVKFQRIFYGKTRKIRASYDLPTSAPRSIGGVRAGEAYASFCVSGNGPDGGQIRVIAPTSFDFTHNESDGLRFSESESGGRTIFSSGHMVTPISAWGCFDGINLNGYVRVPITAPDGRTVIVAAWPEDPAWAGAVSADVASSLPGLEELVGRPLPGTGPVEIREVAGLGDYAGYFNPDTNVAVVSENYSQPGLVAHELSHAWFNGTNFGSTWLSEGYAGWVESQNGGESCGSPPSLPFGAKANLENWKVLGPKATDLDRNTVNYQYGASCWVIASVADKIGGERMTAVLAALFDGTNPYGATDTEDSSPATWQEWLDTVDELGMVPAGEDDLDFVQDELADVGVADDTAELGARSAARAAYHDLIADSTGWSVPQAVRQPLSAWDFSAATDAIETAQRALDAAERADVALPVIDVLQGPIAQQWESAKSQAELDAVATLAGEEALAAEAIAEAQLLEANADPITQIGLLGADVQAKLNAAVTSARAADARSALATAHTAANTIGEAMVQGWIRLAVVVGGILALVAMAIASRRRGLYRLKPTSRRIIGPVPPAGIAPIASEGATNPDTTSAAG